VVKFPARGKGPPALFTVRSHPEPDCGAYDRADLEEAVEMQELLQRVAGLPERTFEPGEELRTDGERAPELYVLIEGELEVRKGNTRISTISDPGAAIGEVGLLLDRPATATVVAVTPTRVHVADDGAELLRTDPGVTVLVARMLAARLDLVTTFLADLRDQYGDANGSLAVVDSVLASLVQRPEPTARPGSARDPDPLY
jgi:CRP/FNR family transcriptional regulator, cyclic AMP receptor protein